jgi:hypothetical protein
MTRTLEQYTPQALADEAARLHQTYGAEGGLREYRALVAGLRQECFNRRARDMDPDGLLRDWAAEMTARHGPHVHVHGITYTWPAALGVARYGEDPEHWPDAFAAADVHRAKRWLYQGVVPEGVTYITVEG